MRVLIVEDEPKMAALVRRGLVEEGHAADVAAQGEDAVWMADAHPYDAIVLDVMLPGVEADPLVLSADRLRLEQALGNMVDNALRHGGGEVTLTAHARDGTAELHVLDGGAGFPEDFLDRAFERFSRAHGGRAEAANRPEGGADVWLALPMRPVR